MPRIFNNGKKTTVCHQCEDTAGCVLTTKFPFSLLISAHRGTVKTKISSTAICLRYEKYRADNLMREVWKHKSMISTN